MKLRTITFYLSTAAGVALAVGCSLRPGAGSTISADGAGATNGMGTGTGSTGTGTGTGSSTSVDPGELLPVDHESCTAFESPRASVLKPDGQIHPKAQEKLSSMTTEQKLAIMNGGNPCPNWDCDFDGTGVPALGIRDFKMRDGPRGVHTHDGTQATTFAVAEARAASFDLDLEERAGAVQGEEMKALQYDIALAPTINTLRHPAWARSQETYGEDPILQGEMGAAATRGIQKFVPACPKHFVGNDTDENRGTVNANIPEQALWENYLKPFEITVMKSDPACIMASYNGVNGTTMTENPLMNSVLRDAWHWEGFVVSDWWATKKNGVASVNSGLDLEMPDNAAFSVLGQFVGSSVDATKVDAAATRILNARARFGQLEDNYPSGAPNPGIVNEQSHKDVALETAVKGAVLLENDGILPIKPEVKSIIVLGPDAERPLTPTDKQGIVHGLGDRGSSNTYPPYAISYTKGLQNLATGVAVTSSANAADAAGKDLVIIPVTMQHEDEGEAFGGGGDRDDLTLSGNHPQHWGAKKPSAFIKEVAAINPNVVVLIAMGGAVIVEDWMSSAKAIVQTFYPGQEGGNAVAKLLLGQENFSGRLPFTVGKSWNDYPTFGNTADNVDVQYLHGYRKFEAEGKEARYWFGYGLSYTTFEYSNLTIDCTAPTKDGRINATITVKNTGMAAGVDVVQAYVGYPNTKVTRPKKELKAFFRTKSLAPGEEQKLQFKIPVSDLAYWDTTSHSWKTEVGVAHDLIIAGSSNPAETKVQKTSFTFN